MPLSRRELFFALPAALAAQPSGDREALVRRHNPVLTEMDTRSPLSVGNGEFAFTADVTGLQTFGERYGKDCPLCTQSQWGWHSFPNPQGFSLEKFRMADGGYPFDSKGQKEAYDWLRENPHRLNLARVRLGLPEGEPARIRQELDLWTGVLTSSFELAGQLVRVETCVHPAQDVLAVRGGIEAAAGGADRVPLWFEPDRWVGLGEAWQSCYDTQARRNWVRIVETP